MSGFVITGEPGAGKTTFVKRICQIWSQYGTEDNMSDLYSLSHYVFVIPIILHLVTPLQSSLFEIFQSQLTGVSTLAVHVIMKCIESQSERVLLVCDGYDELLHQEPIESIIKKEKYPKLKVLVTTRPHGISMLRQLRSQAVEEWARIVGFSDDQIKEYIVLIYKYLKDPQLGERLYQYLVEKSSYLELARIPVRLEMICLVWSKKETLGESLVDLYFMFIKYLLNRMQEKWHSEIFSEDQLLDQNKPLLLKIASLANSWISFSKKQIMFTYKELKNHFQSLMKDAEHMGCLVKYNPSHNLEKSDWMFTHLSLQEFFLAYFLAMTENHEDIAAFISKCPNIDQMQKQEVVLSFLAGLNSSRANIILQRLVKSVKGEHDCKVLVQMLGNILPHYKDQTSIDVPLPHTVNATSNAEIMIINELFICDCNEHNRNLHRLRVFDVTDIIFRRNLVYVTELIIIDRGQGQVDKYQEIETIASSMKGLTSILVLSKNGRQRSNVYHLFIGLPKDKLTHMRFKGLAAVRQVHNMFCKFQNLDFLEVACENTVPPDALNQICASANSCRTLEEVNIGVKGFPQALAILNSDIKVSLTAERVVQKEMDDMFVELLQSCSSNQLNIVKLILDNNNLRFAGRTLGRMLLCMPGIQVLSLGESEMTNDTLKDMADEVKEKEETLLNIKELTLRGNALTGGGVYMKQILEQTPNLLKLDLCGSGVNDDDCKNLSRAPNSNKIQMLHLSTNCIVTGNILTSLWKTCTKLQVLCLKHFQGYISLVFMSFDLLTHLRVLALWGYDLSKSLCTLTLPSGLEALRLAECKMSTIEDLQSLISRMPQSVTHLDVRRNRYGADVTKITKMKEKLCHLRRLNIADMITETHKRLDTDEYDAHVSRIREELQQENPDIKVYCDYDEDMWKMYQYL